LAITTVFNVSPRSCMQFIIPFLWFLLPADMCVAQHLRREEEYDENLCNLARAMGNTLSFICIAKERAKIEKLKLLVSQIMEVVKRASHFIVDHLSRRRLSMYPSCCGALSNLTFIFTAAQTGPCTRRFPHRPVPRSTSSYPPSGTFGRLSILA